MMGATTEIGSDASMASAEDARTWRTDRRSGRWSLIAGVLVLAAAMVFHAVVLYGSGAPAGIDSGNWLAFGRDLVGTDVKPDGVVYPPIVPLLVLAGVSMFGPGAGIAVIGGLAAVAPAAAAFLVLRWAGLGGWAVALAAILAFAPGLGEIAAWGGYPQLLAAPAAVMLLWWLDRWIATGRRTALIVAVVGAVLVLAISHFAALVTAACVAILVAVRTAVTTRGGRGRALRRAGVALGASLVAASPLLLVYGRLAPAVLSTQAGLSAVPTLSLSRVPSRFVDIHGGAAASVLVLGLAAGVLAIVLAPPHGRDTLWVLTAALLGGVVATLLWTHEPRVLYEVPLVAAVGIGALVRELLRAPDRRRWVAVSAAGLLIVALGVTSVSGITVFRRQRADYAVADEAISAALRWVREATPERALVAAPALGSVPLGWWIEGLGERQAVAAAPAEWLVYPQERRIATRARRLFAALERDVAAGLREADRLGVDYLFVPKATPTYELLLVDIEAGRLEAVFENAGVVIFRAPAPEGSP
jgi:hypothetical protein